MEKTIKQTEEQRRVQDTWEMTICSEAHRCPLARSREVFMNKCANYELGEDPEACPEIRANYSFEVGGMCA